jgi:hypothetical protein
VPHNLTSLAAIIDDLRLPIQNALGEKVNTRKWVKMRQETGGGKQALIPVITADDTGHGFTSDGGAIAAAAGGDPVNLTVPYRFYVGRFRISGPTMEAAGESMSQLEDAASFASERLISSIGSAINRFNWSGGRTLGFINERANPGAAAVWEFNGDTVKVGNLIAALGGPITCQIIRQDTYAVVGTVEVTAAGTAQASTITIADALNTTGVGDGFAMAVRCTEAALGLGNQSEGIYGNLGDNTHFGVDRTDATGGDNALLQSNVITLGVVDGVNTRGVITLARIQTLMDTIAESSRGQANLTRGFFHPSLRRDLAGLFQNAASLSVNVSDGKAPSVDAGPASYSYAGVKFEEDVDCGRGMLTVVEDDTWMAPTLKQGDFDGAVYQVQGSDAVERVWKDYGNLTCQAPNWNGALVGLAYDGAG